MTFDSNRAWKEGASWFGANREVLLVLGGVFLMLPNLALSLLSPAPKPADGATDQQMAAMIMEYWKSVAGYMVPIAMAQAIGVLSVYALFTDRRRPTVGEAIKQSLFAFLPYLGTHLLFWLGVTLLTLPISLVGGLAGPMLAAWLLIAAVFALMVRTSLATPVIVIEGVRNPWTALRRSWSLTQGNGFRLTAFYLLLTLACVFILFPAAMLIGLAAQMAAGAETGAVIASVVVSMILTAMILCFLAVVAATHRQLAGPSPDQTSKPFE